MVEFWATILDVVLLLGGAVLFGVAFERLGLGSVVGYLVVGVIVGPSVLHLIEGGEIINLIAEVGVSLLLFTIGLEFSWKRLVAFGKRAVLGGAIALVAVGVVFSSIAAIAGLDWKAAIVIGSAASLGSTAIVLRIIRVKNDMDSIHGRFSLAILLAQDVALIPLVLIVSALSGQSEDVAKSIGGAVLNTGLFVIGMILFVSLVVPRLLDEKAISKNREIPILIAITMAVGASWAAHSLGVPPALGAFIAGLLLAEGKFADQMRADVLPLRTLFMTIFFVSIGLLTDVQWIWQNLALVCGGTVVLILLKTVITYVSIRPFQVSIVEALATSLAIAQVGEFSFVLLDTALEGGVIEMELFKLATSITLLTLFITPVLSGNAYKIALKVAKALVPKRRLAKVERQAHRLQGRAGHVIVIGFGEAGKAASMTLANEKVSVLVLEINPGLVREAEHTGVSALTGDATQIAILERAAIRTAAAIVVAVPDHTAVRSIVTQCKQVAPDVKVIVRSRYHVYSNEIDVLGADIVLDEEVTIGLLLGKRTLGVLKADDEQPADGSSLR